MQHNPQGPQTPRPAAQNAVTPPPAPLRKSELKEPNPSPSNNHPMLPWARTTLNLASGNGNANGNGNGGHSHS